MTQYFYVVNASNTSSELAMQSSGSGAQVTLQPKQTGAFGSVTNQMWEFTQSGHIRSASNPAQVLAYDTEAQTVVIAEFEPGNDYQRWQQSYYVPPGDSNWKPSQGAILNLGNGQALSTYAGQTAGNNVSVTTNELGGWNPTTCLWEVIPNPAPIGQSATLRSRVVNSATSVADLALSIPMPSRTAKPPYPFSMPATGTAVVADTVKQFGHNAIWEFNSDGCLVSALNSKLALSAGPNNTVVIYVLQPGPQPFQTWWISEDGAIINGQMVNGSLMALTVATDGSGQAAPGAAITLTPYDNAATAAQKWQPLPGVSLQTLLYQPPQPFPLGDADEQAAYDALMTAIWAPIKAPAGGLRAQYPNLAAPLGSYQTIMNALPPQNDPDGNYTSENWQSVVQQLNFELTAAQAVRNLFAQLASFHLALTEAESDLLLELAALTSIQPTTKVSFWSHISWTQIVEGLVYTALSAASIADGMGAEGSAVKKIATVAGKGLPVIANLIQTGINGYSGSTPPSKAQQETAEFSVVQQQILETTAQMGAALAQLESGILTDWSKLKLFYEMICNTGDTDSLYWPPSLSPQLVAQLLPGFIVNTLQLLMPVSGNFKPDRWGYMQLQSGSPAEGFTPFESSGSNTVSEFVVYRCLFTNSSNGLDTYDDYKITFGKKALAEYLWGSGAIPYNVFAGGDGWNLGYDEKNLGDACITYLYNNTPYGLYCTSGDWGSSQLVMGPYSFASMFITSGTKISPQTLPVSIYQDGTNTLIATFSFDSNASYSPPKSVAPGFSVTGGPDEKTTPYTCNITLSTS